MTRLSEDLSVVIDNGRGTLRIYYKGEPLLEQRLNMGLVRDVVNYSGDLDMKSLESLLKTNSSNDGSEGDK